MCSKTFSVLHELAETEVAQLRDAVSKKDAEVTQLRSAAKEQGSALQDAKTEIAALSTQLTETQLKAGRNSHGCTTVTHQFAPVALLCAPVVPRSSAESANGGSGSNDSPT
jgi:capsule polysaccharide export protein KpsE/RkpR